MEGEKLIPKEQTLSEEEWKTQSREIHELRDKLFDELQKIYKETDLRNNYFAKYQTITQVIKDRIQASGIGTSKYAAWHIINGGGTEQKYSPFIDFDGDLSIKKFLEEKLEELKSVDENSG